LIEVSPIKTKFQGGNLKYFYNNWKCYTKDCHILDINKNGLKLDFTNSHPIKNSISAHPFSIEENNVLTEEIKKLLSKGVICPCNHQKIEYISTVFTRDKKDGSKRMILNLKFLNEHINYNHFKIESIKNVLNLIRPGAYMASIDLKDAFFSVPIFPQHQRFLKFYFDRLYQFRCMPQGYGPAMRIFTKITKVPFSYLRGIGYSSVVYVDDSYLQGHNYIECYNNICATVNLLKELGFTIHPDKSSFLPAQNIQFLGFVLCSITMTIKLTVDKKSKIKSLCMECINKDHISIRKLSSLIGNIVASFPGVEFGPLYYRNLENDKIFALKTHKFDFDKLTKLSYKSTNELHWWINNIDESFSNISKPDPDLIVYTDASLTGWGITNEIISSRGFWHSSEIKHINVLELKAIYIAIKTYHVKNKIKHMKIMCDNTTAISYLNNMGGTKSKACNKVAYKIWTFAIDNNLWLSAAHIPGKDNVEADIQSRNLDDSTEWQLNPLIFQKIVKKFGLPDIDLFATRINKQISSYVSWYPEPEAIAINQQEFSKKIGHRA